MKPTAVVSTIAGLFAVGNAASVQVNFYSDTSCRNYIGSSFIDYDPSQGGTYHQGGPAGSRGGLYVNSNGLGLDFRGFTNLPDGSDPFTGNVVDGECIGTLDGLYAVFIV